MDYNEAFNVKYDISLKKFIEKSLVEKCDDLFKNFKDLLKNRYSSVSEDRTVKDFVLYKKILLKLSTLTESEKSFYVQFVEDKIEEIKRVQMGCDKISNYMLFAEVVRNLPDSEDEKLQAKITGMKKSIKGKMLQEAIKD